jgi:hypothetical protein
MIMTRTMIGTLRNMPTMRHDEGLSGSKSCAVTGIDLVEKNPDHKIKAEQHDGDAQQMQRATSGPGSFRCRRVAKRSIIASSRFQTRLLMASGGHRRARRE